jgi:uracil-DNA glycosylase family 4
MEIPTLRGQMPPTYQREPHPVIPFDYGCRACPYGNDKAGPVGGVGPSDLSKVRLLVISDYPGHYEVQEGYPFVPKPPVYQSNRSKKIRMSWANAGAALRYALGQLGLNSYDDCWLTNTLKCSPAADSGKVKETELDTCTRLWLYQEVWQLHLVNPKLPIWLAGSQALAGFRRTFKPFPKGSVNDFRRKVTWWLEHPVVVTWNPSAYCRSEFRATLSHSHPDKVKPVFDQLVPLTPWEVYHRDWALLKQFLQDYGSTP